MLLDLYKQTGRRIINGWFDKDIIGRYTQLGARGSSLVDYVITTQNLLNTVDSFCVKKIQTFCQIVVSLIFLFRFINLVYLEM